MLSYMKVNIENDPYQAGIIIRSEGKKSNVGSITGINIYRKSIRKPTWMPVQSLSVESAEDLSFSLLDTGVLSRNTYSYYIDVVNGNTIVETEVFSNIECFFEGLCVSDGVMQYLAGLDVDISESRNREVNYVTTLRSRTPYRVSNADTNYTTGDIAALFLDFTADKKRFQPDLDHAYSDKVIDFLSSNRGKIIKTGDGRGWYASIDSVIDKPFDDRFEGYNKIQFSFTEIGDMPLDYMIEVE